VAIDRLSSESSDYLVLDLIGQGAFAKVAKCVKSATNETVAVKIRKKRSATEAEEEDAILQKLRAFDPDTWHFVRWDSSFIYKAHLCQEFELLDMNLKEFVNMRHTSSLPLRDIRPILHQVATALQLLKSLGISHSDLKPENIMLVDHVRQPLKIKLIDFGSACDASKAEQGSCIQHRWYRAPETILGLPCNEAIDMWSLGCIAAELFLGFPLYPGSCDYERIWKITQTQGQLPGYFLSYGHKIKESILAIKCDRHTFANWPRPPVASQLGECLCAAHTGAAFIFPLRLNKMSGHRDIAIHSTRSPTISR
uniref:Protein kinase domain-containing protein n=1 Tax=Sander lucioperca TaxID=283035 RepID=A0A8C9ZGX3_SANLU